jgi:hypothetical protein
MKRRSAVSLVIGLLLVVSGHASRCRAEAQISVVSADQCDTLDIPDESLRAFRAPNGSITAFATHYRNRALTGANFAALKKNCAVVYEGKLDSDSAHFDYKTWITATWLAEDGSVVALGHNEYQAHELPGHCRFTDYRSCWYNSIVLLKSDDLGRTFHRVDHDEAVIAPNFTDAVGQGHPRGYTSPTNLVRSGDYLYTLIGYAGSEKTDTGRCVLRTRLPVTLHSWEILTDKGYVAPTESAYVSGGSKAHCTYATGMPGFVGSIAKVAGTKLFISVVAEDVDGGSIVVYFSDDLVHWRDRAVIEKLSLFWSKDCASGKRYSYPSLVDENSKTLNFDVIGRTATLYMVQGDCRVGTNRKLVKIDVAIPIPPGQQSN